MTTSGLKQRLEQTREISGWLRLRHSIGRFRPSNGRSWRRLGSDRSRAWSYRP